MKKYTPYIFPLVVLSVVFLLVFRWYSMRTERLDQDLFAEGIEIENLSEAELAESVSGAGDYMSTNLVSADEDSQGTIRYEIKDGKVRFSVIANLPNVDANYKVWLKEVDGEAMREVFSLTFGKGGHVGSAAIPSELLPFEIIVSDKDNATDALEENILRGMIEVPEVVEEEVVN